uniref:IgLON family member 5 n=1 Tax=Fundulus heteroclitus TaxID=8078 RepID=A0A3Q2QDG3_FUNHE
MQVIVNISKSVSLNEGESVTLYCLAVGRPEPTVTWRNQKCKIFILSPGLNPNENLDGEFLDIATIRRDQAEDYECITHNGVAPPDQQKVRITVNCKYPSSCGDINLGLDDDSIKIYID